MFHTDTNLKGGRELQDIGKLNLGLKFANMFNKFDGILYKAHAHRSSVTTSAQLYNVHY